MYAAASSLRAFGNFHILHGKLSKFALSPSVTQSSKCYISFTQHLCSNNDTVEIGGVSKQLKEAKNKELIPTKYGINNLKIHVELCDCDFHIFSL